MHNCNINKCCTTFLKYSALFGMCLVQSTCGEKNKYAEPERETTYLTDNLRAQRGGTYITLSHGVTHYQLTGPSDGNVVVFIHGASLAMWVWDKQVNALSDAGFRVLRYDQYSRGLSDYIPVTYNRDLYRTQLFELLDSLGITKPVTLIGHSFGGFIASYFAATYPKKVGKLIFISPGVTVGRVLKFLIKSRIGKWYVHHNIKNLSNTIDDRLIKQRIPLDPYKNIYLDQISIKGFERSVASLFTNAIGDYLPYYREIGKLKIPVLLLRGTNDNVANEKQMKMAIKAMPQVNYQRLQGNGHVPQFEASEKLNTLLVEFISKEQ